MFSLIDTFESMPKRFAESHRFFDDFESCLLQHGEPEGATYSLLLADDTPHTHQNCELFAGSPNTGQYHRIYVG